MPQVKLAKDWVRSPTRTEAAGTTVTVDDDTARWLVTNGYVKFPAGGTPSWVHMTHPGGG